MKRHAIAALLGLALGFTALTLVDRLAHITEVALSVSDVVMQSETGLDSNVMDY